MKSGASVERIREYTRTILYSLLSRMPINTLLISFWSRSGHWHIMCQSVIQLLSQIKIWEVDTDLIIRWKDLKSQLINYLTSGKRIFVFILYMNSHDVSWNIVNQTILIHVFYPFVIRESKKSVYSISNNGTNWSNGTYV